MRIEKYKNKWKAVKGYLWWKKSVKVFPGEAEAKLWLSKQK